MTSTVDQPVHIKNDQELSLPKWALCGFAVLAMAIGVGLRFFRITDNTFLFYDEGMWILQGQALVEAIESEVRNGSGKLASLINAAFHLTLHTGKALWAFISMMRGLFVGADGFFFGRLVSATFGSLTLSLVYLFSLKFYRSKAAALTAAAVLAMMPTHIFYSRVALQEAVTAFFFTLGMYLFIFGQKYSWRIFLSGICFAAVYFVNYRMIIIPFFLACAELYLCLAQRRRLDWLKWLVSTLVFVAMVVGFGLIDNAANLKVTFGWMGHQKQLAEGTFALLNVFSYPYYMLTFEGVGFALLFWAGAYLLWKRRWEEAFPFVFVLLFMAVFSLPQEKGVRYLTSAIPFMAMTVGWMMCQVYQRIAGRKRLIYVVGIGLLMAVWQMREGGFIAGFQNAYAVSIDDHRQAHSQAKFVSTQSMIQKLFADSPKDVMEFRYNMNYLTFLAKEGYDYLVIDPQAYVSFTADDLRFQTKLKGFLHFIRESVEPEAVYPHMNHRQLKRFVLEHNEHLGRSLSFLREQDKHGLGQLYVYDLRKVVTLMNVAVAQSKRE